MELCIGIAICIKVNRDLKPENILFDSKKIDAGVKIIDFGASVIMEKGEGNLKRRIGTVSVQLYLIVIVAILRGSRGVECELQ
jgi:serine/threonine protein kinase